MPSFELSRQLTGYNGQTGLIPSLSPQPNSSTFVTLPILSFNDCSNSYQNPNGHRPSPYASSMISLQKITAHRFNPTWLTDQPIRTGIRTTQSHPTSVNWISALQRDQTTLGITPTRRLPWLEQRWLTKNAVILIRIHHHQLEQLT